MEINFKNLEDFNKNLILFNNNIKFDGNDVDYIDGAGQFIFDYLYNYINNIILTNFNNVLKLIDVDLITANILSFKFDNFNKYNITDADIYYEILYYLNYRII